MLIKKIISLSFLAIFFVLSGNSSAGTNVNINIGIGAPPPVVIPQPPAVFLIPGTYAYYAPDVGVDIIFYHGYWYRPYEGRWYKGKTYNGPWLHISTSFLPQVIINLPPNYRHIPQGHDRIPYGQFKKNWSGWEKERYWEHKYRHEYKHEDKEHYKHREKGHRSKGKHRDDD
ncbi:MAG: hypothetical protein AB1632_11215 [Nitrospirota bacterium]